MSCNCLAERNRELAEIGLKLITSGDGEIPSLDLRYQSNGLPVRSLKMLPTYCPWCGRKYDADPAAREGKERQDRPEPGDMWEVLPPH